MILWFALKNLHWRKVFQNKTLFHATEWKYSLVWIIFIIFFEKLINRFSLHNFVIYFPISVYRLLWKTFFFFGNFINHNFLRSINSKKVTHLYINFPRFITFGMTEVLKWNLTKNLFMYIFKALWANINR